jgi:hypothetical protein
MRARCLACGRVLGQQKGSYGSGRGWGLVHKEGRPCRANYCAEQGINPDSPTHRAGRERALVEAAEMLALLPQDCGWRAWVFYNLHWVAFVRCGPLTMAGPGRDGVGGYSVTGVHFAASGATPIKALDDFVRQTWEQHKRAEELVRLAHSARGR